MNDFGLRFDPLFPMGWVWGLAVIVLAFLFWLELMKKQKFIAYRIAALFFLMIAVIGLILQPSFSSKQNHGAMLLAPGYDRLKVDSVLKRNPDTKILRINSADPFPNAELASENSVGNDIKYIFGEGLTAYVLEEFSQSNFIFFPSQLPSGVIELNIPEIFSSRVNKVSGIFNAQQKTKLKLVGPAGTEDSTVVDQQRNTFSFSLIPKQPGLFIYHLISEDSLGAKISERLPIEVKPANKLRILFLQEFPSSEFRHLKNFLAEDGHSLVVRTRTSKSIFSEEFINTPKFQLKNITVETLKAFDLLLADSKTIESLASLEKSNLEQAVRNGLGLIVVRDKPSKKNEFYSVNGKVISTDTAHLRITNKSHALSALPIEIELEDGIKSLLRNKKRVLTGYRFFGAGKIGFQLLQETFRIKLEGNAADYSAVWSTLIEKVSRKKSRDFELNMNTYLPYHKDEPISFSITSSGKTPEVVSDSMKMPLLEDVIISDYWHGKTWAGDPGWHQLRMTDSSTVNYFVHENFEWKALRAVHLRSQTRIAQVKTSENLLAFTERKSVSPLIFYIIFLFAGGFLWLAPKI